MPPSQFLSGFSWSLVACAVVPQGAPTISGNFSELGARKGGCFFARGGEKKMAARETLSNRRSISGEGREAEACVAGGGLGPRHFGFPEAVGCGKHCG